MRNIILLTNRITFTFDGKHFFRIILYATNQLCNCNGSKRHVYIEVGHILIPWFNVAAFNWTDSDGIVRSSVQSNQKMTKKMKKEAQSNQGLFEAIKWLQCNVIVINVEFALEASFVSSLFIWIIRQYPWTILANQSI